MGPLGVVVDQPRIEIGLQLLDRLVELAAKDGAEELIQHCAVEALDEAVGLRPAHARCDARCR